MDLYEATKGFVTLFDFEVAAHEDGVFEDSGVKVEEVVLRRTGVRNCPLLNDNWREDEQGDWKDYYDCDVQVGNIRIRTKMDMDHMNYMNTRPISASSPPDQADWT